MSQSAEITLLGIAALGALAALVVATLALRRPAAGPGGRGGVVPGPAAGSPEPQRDLIDDLGAVVWESDATSTRFTFMSRRTEEMLGYPPERFVDNPGFWTSLIHTEDRERVLSGCREAAAAGRDFEIEYRMTARDGHLVWVRNIARVIHDEAGRPRSIRGLMVDVSERRRAMEEMRVSEDRYRLLFDNNPHSMWVSDAETLGFLAVNDAAVRAYGYSREEFLRMTIKDIRPPEDLPALMRELARVQPGLYSPGTWRHRRKDGTLFDVEIVVHTLLFDGRPARLTLASDVTQRRQAERELRAERDHSAVIVRTTPSLVCGLAPSGTTLFMNPAGERLTGYRAEELVGRGFLEVLLPRDGAQQAGSILNHLATADLRDSELVLTTRSGESRTLAWNWIRRTDESGRLIEILGFGEDVSERRRLEDQLRQSQKMEAIGRLAGGVAHDFNNLMTAVSGYSELLLGRFEKDDPVRRDLEEIKKAGDRAAALTRQLLAFSRRQVLRPEVLDLNAVVAGMDQMLRRLIGEDIELMTALSPALGMVRADPGQIEQVIMNLAVNSRDAMPRGGKLTIETGNIDLDETYARGHAEARPGAYVMLAVSDTGEGMDAETRAHLFEPFFTTKGQGEGTGLGLSMVYGIVKQSGGNVWVYTEPGHGTTVKVYLPHVARGAERVAAPAVASGPAHGDETVLLVEDEEVVRSLAREILEMHGYSVLVARDGLEALQICERHPGRIHLLLTDVVMPRMNGRDLVERAAPMRPDMRILFMSGYTSDTIVHHGVLDPGTAYLQKPFSVDGLAHRVREVLDAHPGRTN
ncbi:MAG TPA: PAS domain S-box protein [Candidatus Polarisedimenticolia bacterium]|nr:PAS domain S-box protein [Candidatus Polarisedimenticolia bacterium]